MMLNEEKLSHSIFLRFYRLRSFTLVLAVDLYMAFKKLKPF